LYYICYGVLIAVESFSLRADYRWWDWDVEWKSMCYRNVDYSWAR